MVKWQDTGGLQNEGIRLKLVFEKCESVRGKSGFVQFIKILQIILQIISFSHMETEPKKG